MAASLPDVFSPKKPLDIGGREFTENKFAYYRWLRDEAPVYHGKISIMRGYFLSRYDDCVSFVQDSRFVRNRSTARGGGSRFPIPLPKSIAALGTSMINEDEPEHRRLRTLVQQAFTARSLTKLETRIEELTRDLLDQVEPQNQFDLKRVYATAIPETVISEIMGVAEDEAPYFQDLMRVLSTGLSSLNVVRTLWDLRKGRHFMRNLIARKRREPGEDILTGLIQAEEEGTRLSEDELTAMTFLLMIAGFETTQNLITNGALTLIQHPEAKERLLAEPSLWETAVEELVRFAGPIITSKPQYAMEDVEWHGVTIPKGSGVFPLYGAANRDPRVFENPEVFDIERTPNKHLGFGWGPHFCLGASLARMETRITLQALFERNPDVRLAVSPEQLRLVPIPGWHRYESLPVVLQ
jgi:cytochrome P450